MEVISLNFESDKVGIDINSLKRRNSFKKEELIHPSNAGRKGVSVVCLGKGSLKVHFFLRVGFEFSVFLLDWLLSHSKRALSVMLFNPELEEDEFMPFPRGISAN